MEVNYKKHAENIIEMKTFLNSRCKANLHKRLLSQKEKNSPLLQQRKYKKP